MKAKLLALTRYLRGMVNLEDIGLLVCAGAVVTGLWWIYPPAALILPGASFIIWAAWRRWRPGRTPARRG